MALLFAGCNAPEPEQTTVEPPTGTEWAECPPSAARPIAVPFRTEVANDDLGRGAGLHRIDARTFLWVYANYTDTLREDRITRVNPVHVARDTQDVVHVCTRVDVAAPTEVDAQPRSYIVAARLTAQEALPEGTLRVVVNWVAGCPCATLPRGNATAIFD